MKKKMVKRLMAASVAGTLAVTMFAGCGGSSDSKDSSAKTEDTSEDKTTDAEENAETTDGEDETSADNTDKDEVPDGNGDG